MVAEHADVRPGSDREAKKCTWPDRKTVVNTSIVVIVATFIIGFYLWGCDVVLVPAVNWIYKLFGA